MNSRHQHSNSAYTQVARCRRGLAPLIGDYSRALAVRYLS